MKNIFEIKKGLVTLLVILTCFGCSDNSKLGLPIKESTPPTQPEVTTIRNINGGAVIHYKVPTDEDLLCISATYTINGKQYIAKSSAYVDSIRVEGFGKEGKFSIKLRSIDKNRNESAPVDVAISPKKAPVELIFESLNVQTGFGGIKVSWDNPTEANVIVSVSYKDDLGDWISQENFYTSSKKDMRSIRGFNTDPRMFGIVVRDRWDNYSKLLETEHTPYFEEEIDRSKFQATRSKLPGDCNIHGATSLPKLWDGSTALMDCLFTDNTGVQFPYVTFDMGQTAKLSRFKMWQLTEGTWIYNQSNLRTYDVYGCNEITADMYETGSLDGWTLLCEAECRKPSGDGPVTNEDREYINNGDEHEVFLEAPPVRYIRIHMKKTWDPSSLQKLIGDIRFWGEVQK